MIQDELLVKTISALQNIYSWTQYDDNKYDIFRLKDILDSLSTGQWESKSWAVNELAKKVEKHHKHCSIIGGWYGLFSHLMIERGITLKIRNVDLDETCISIGEMLRVHEGYTFAHRDGLSEFEHDGDDRIFVCTACEHIDNDDLVAALEKKHPNALVLLQSNDYYDIDSHINCKDSLQDFVDSLPLKNILYKGEFPYKDEYTRFMVIGK